MTDQSEQEQPEQSTLPPMEAPPAGADLSATARVTGKVVEQLSTKQGQRLLTLALFLLGPPLQLWLMGLAGADPQAARAVASWWMELAQGAMFGQ